MSYLRIGDTVTFGGADVEGMKTLPPNMYSLFQDPKDFQYKLSIKGADFDIPEKLYGDIEFYADHIIRSWNQGNKDMGVILSGIGGGGKTLLAKLICKKLNLPIIYISEPEKGSQFLKAMSKIDTDCVVLFEEYDKIYAEDSFNEQKDILALTDGLFQSQNSKKLYVITCNEEEELSPYLRGRMGRFRYHIRYEGLPLHEIEKVLYEMNPDIDSAVFYKLARVLYGQLKSVSYDTLVEVSREIEDHPEMFTSVEKMKTVMNMLNLERASTFFNVEIESLCEVDASSEDIEKHDLPESIPMIAETERTFNPLVDEFAYRASMWPSNPDHSIIAKYYDSYTFVTMNEETYDIVIKNEDTIVATEKEGSTVITFKRGRAERSKNLVF